MDEFYAGEDLDFVFVYGLTQRLRVICSVISKSKKESVKKKDGLALVDSLLRESEDLADAAFMYKKEDIYLSSMRFNIDVIELKSTLSKKYRRDSISSIEASLMKLILAIFECQNNTKGIQEMSLYLLKSSHDANAN